VKSQVKCVEVHQSQVNALDVEKMNEVTDLQHWLKGTRIDTSSWECFPNPLPLSRWIMKLSLPNFSNVS
jgi:hypothetical protein